MENVSLSLSSKKRSKATFMKRFDIIEIKGCVLSVEKVVQKGCLII